MDTRPPVTDSAPGGTRRLWPLLVILLAVPTLGISGCEGSENETGDEAPPALLGDELRSAAYWVDQYGEVSADELDAEDARLLADTHAILDRLRPHFSDARTRLVILGEEFDEDAPLPAFAAALPDDTIVMSLEGLRLCYRGVTRAEGDSRAACVLAHELAHREADHHWFLEAAAMIRAFGGESDVLRSLAETLGSGTQEAKKLELEADRMAVIRMTAAGFDPEALFGARESFFDEWVGTAAGRLAYQNESHPAPGARAVHARSWFREAADLGLEFRDGVDAYDRGEFVEAVEAFERVEREFPSREVLSNLGLSELQLAARALGKCDGALLLRWRLPVEIDRKTLLARTTLRGDERSECYDEEPYLTHWRRAKTALDEALQKEETYSPAILNLAALHMLDDSPAWARSYATTGAELFPDDSRFRNALLTVDIADLLARDKSFDEEAAAHAALHEEHPDDPDIAFNAAKALMLAGQYDRAEPVWRAFLRVEPDGEWAEIARWNLGEEPESPANEDQPAK